MLFMSVELWYQNSCPINFPNIPTIPTAYFSLKDPVKGKLEEFNASIN